MAEGNLKYRSQKFTTMAAVKNQKKCVGPRLGKVIEFKKGTYMVLGVQSSDMKMELLLLLL